MSTGFNTDLQSILNSAKSQLSSLGVNGVSSASGNDYLNSVWGLVQNGETAINGNDQQKAQAIANMVQKLMSMVMSLGTNENSKATKEVSNNDNKANQVNQNADKTAEEVKSKVDEIVGNIKSGTADIQKAIAQIEEIGGNQNDIEEAQKAVLKQAEIIEENLRIINNGVSNTDAKQEALKNINKASKTIQGLTDQMSFLSEKAQTKIQEQNAIIENSTNELANLVIDAATTISNGTNDLKGFVQNAAQQMVTNTTTATTGAANEVVGATATTSGTATSWVPVFGQTASSKLIQIGADQTAAGATRIGGSAKTLASLTQAIGKMGSNIQGITGLVGNVQSESDNAVSLVGNYQTKLDSIITATGSWSQVADANADLTSAIAEYEGQGESTNIWNQMNGSQNQEGSEAQTSQGTGAIDFDVNRFKTAFGI